jgi:signal transduction histidine kinase
LAQWSDSLRLLLEEAQEVACHLERQPFPELAGALRICTPEILARWRKRSIEVMPSLDELPIVEFEDSIGTILAALAGALEQPGTESVKQLMEASPAHGSSRFVKNMAPHMMLAEERILRSAIILELRTALNRPLAAEEAAAFHELFDLMSEYSLLSLMRLRGESRDRQILDQVSGMHRLADLGTLAAGLAHDAANLMLPIRTRLDFLASAELSGEAREDVEGLLLLMDQLQDFITNLRILSVDPHRRGEVVARVEERPRMAPAIDLAAWWARVLKFHRRMLPGHLELKSELQADLPRVMVPAPVLSQAVFNLIRNAQNALRGQSRGCIIVRAAPSPDGTHIDLSVEDDGPGMSAEVLARCFDPYFSAAPCGQESSAAEDDGAARALRAVPSGSGLGLAIVSTMVVGSGGRIHACSPPPGKPRGALFVLSLPV